MFSRLWGRCIARSFSLVARFIGSQHDSTHAHFFQEKCLFFGLKSAFSGIGLTAHFSSSVNYLGSSHASKNAELSSVFKAFGALYCAQFFSSCTFYWKSTFFSSCTFYWKSTLKNNYSNPRSGNRCIYASGLKTAGGHRHNPDNTVLRCSLQRSYRQPDQKTGRHPCQGCSQSVHPDHNPE